MIADLVDDFGIDLALLRCYISIVINPNVAHAWMRGSRSGRSEEDRRLK
jgi:hypothetical protein